MKKKVIYIVLGLIVTISAFSFYVFKAKSSKVIDQGIADFEVSATEETDEDQDMESQSAFQSSESYDAESFKPFTQTEANVNTFDDLLNSSIDKFAEYDITIDELKQQYWEYNDVEDGYSCVLSKPGYLYSIIIYSTGAVEIYVTDLSADWVSQAQEAMSETAEPVVDNERKAASVLPIEIENSVAFKNYCNSEYYLPKELFVVTDANGYYEFSAQGDGFDISGVCVDGKCSIFVLDPDDLNNAFAEFVDQ